MVEAWQASGLSMRAYAMQNGISERRLGLWRRRLLGPRRERGRGPSPADGDGAFVPVAVADAPTATLDVVIDGRVTVRVHRGCDLELLAQTVAALRC